MISIKHFAYFNTVHLPITTPKFKPAIAMLKRSKDVCASDRVVTVIGVRHSMQ